MKKTLLTILCVVFAASFVIAEEVKVAATDEGFLGKGYACPTEEAIEAIGLMNNCENINLDLTYSGKAFAAIVDHARENLLQNKVVLFWDTFCGYDYDEIISTVNYKALPRNLHIYFD